jgi:hypothetical protein
MRFLFSFRRYQLLYFIHNTGCSSVHHAGSVCAALNTANTPPRAGGAAKINIKRLANHQGEARIGPSFAAAGAAHILK